MSVSAIGSSTISQFQQTQRPQGPGKEIREGLDQLRSAVESGNLDAAQEAYDSLSELQSARQSTASASTSTKEDPLSKLLTEVGSALESGDISQVQSAFASFGPAQGGPAQGGPGGGPGGAGGPPPGPPPGGAGPSDEVKSAIGELASSLGSGDLESAQSAYSSLADLLSSAADDDDEEDDTTSSTSTTSSASLPEDRFKALLSDIGSALDSGNLASAQSLFSALAPRGSQGVNVVV